MRAPQSAVCSPIERPNGARCTQERPKRRLLFSCGPQLGQTGQPAASQKRPDWPMWARSQAAASPYKRPVLSHVNPVISLFTIIIFIIIIIIIIRPASGQGGQRTRDCRQSPVQCAVRACCSGETVHERQSTGDSLRKTACGRLSLVDCLSWTSQKSEPDKRRLCAPARQTSRTSASLIRFTCFAHTVAQHLH